MRAHLKAEIASRFRPDVVRGQGREPQTVRLHIFEGHQKLRRTDGNRSDKY